MPLISTAALTSTSDLDSSTNLQVYCGIDCCIPLEVFEELSRQHNRFPAIYDFERALQGPYLEMMFRGFAVDELNRRLAAKELERRLEILRLRLNRMAEAIWDKPLIKPGGKTPHYTTLQSFFYQALRLPEVWISQKGERKLSTNREALEKLEQHLYARPFVAAILAIRDLSKDCEVLTTQVDSDGRLRCSYNIAGTETGRPSSSKNAFGTGGNLQNITPALRYSFVADSGWKLCQIDYEQVEARDEGFFCGCLFDDWSLLDACESGDLHTYVTRQVWPGLPWTGDLTTDKEIADTTPFYRDFSHRHMVKRGTYLTNYMGTAWTMSRVLKIPQAVAEDFQARYCRSPQAAFPCVPQFWQWVATQLQTSATFITPFGRKRKFWGRPDDDTTLREAIANLPQSTTADRTNLGLWRIWHHMPQVQLLGQGYDSIVFQYRQDADENEIIQEALSHTRVELFGPNGRRYVVPAEAKIGWNWGNYNINPAKGRVNHDGLVKWSPFRPDLRQRQVGLQRSII